MISAKSPRAIRTFGMNCGRCETNSKKCAPSCGFLFHNSTNESAQSKQTCPRSRPGWIVSNPAVSNLCRLFPTGDGAWRDSRGCGKPSVPPSRASGRTEQSLTILRFSVPVEPFDRLWIGLSTHTHRVFSQPAGDRAQGFKDENSSSPSKRRSSTRRGDISILSQGHGKPGA